MSARFRLAVCMFCLAVAPGFALAHEGESTSGRLGKVSFPTSCDPKPQPALERAVALLHSFWCIAAEKAFTEIHVEAPSCESADRAYELISTIYPLAGNGAPTA